MITGLGRDEARAYFKELGLTYNDITEGDILALVMLLNTEIKRASKAGETSIRNLTISRKTAIKYRTNGTLKTCFLFINGSYFTQRECISFNEDGFIGFAGWADETNIKPIITAFRKWCDELAKEKEMK